MIPGLTQINAIIPDSSVSNVNMNVVDLGSVDNLDATHYADQFAGAIHDITSSYNFLNAVVTSPEVMSTEDLSDIQNQLEKFTVSTQLVSKAVSTVVKDVDSLVRMQ